MINVLCYSVTKNSHCHTIIFPTTKTKTHKVANFLKIYFLFSFLYFTKVSFHYKIVNIILNSRNESSRQLSNTLFIYLM